MPPIGVRLDSCHAFVKRARKRLTVAEEEVTKLCTKNSRIELEQGLARLAQLREEATSREREIPARVAGDPPATIPCRIEKGASVSDGTVGTTDRNSSSDRDWEDGDD